MKDKTDFKNGLTFTHRRDLSLFYQRSFRLPPSISAQPAGCAKFEVLFVKVGEDSSGSNMDSCLRTGFDRLEVGFLVVGSLRYKAV